jgi:hypothetical protein
MEAPSYGGLTGASGETGTIDSGAGGLSGSGGTAGSAATGGIVNTGGTGGAAGNSTSVTGGAGGQTSSGGAAGQTNTGGLGGSSTGGASGQKGTGGGATAGNGGATGAGGTSTGGAGGSNTGGSGGQPNTGGVGGTSTGAAGGTSTGGAGGAAGAGTGGTGGQGLPPLFAYYPFDQTAGPSIPDASGNGHDGTLAGTATFPAGVIGNDLDLPGATSDYVALPSALLQTLTSVTIAVWVNVHGDHIWQRVFDFGSSSNVYMFLTPHNGTSNVARFAITTSGNSGTSEQRLDAAAVLPVSAWTHVAVVLGTGGGTLYINGAAIATNAAMTLRPSDLGATTNDWLGRSQFTADPAFDGQIDDLRIYASALSAPQIMTIYTGR